MPARRRLVLAAVLLIVLVAALAYLLTARRAATSPADRSAASVALARGVGRMEQFDYASAVEDFAEAERLAPGWRPARLNRAIALYNAADGAGAPVLDEATSIFRALVAEDPSDAHAHYNLGVIQKYRGEYREAQARFKRVAELDPADAHAWLFLGASDPDSATSEESLRCFETALRLNPYLNQARYRVATHLVLLSDPARREAELKLFDALQVANWEDESREKYTELGKYAAVVAECPAPPPATGPAPAFDPAPKLTPLPATTPGAAGAMILLDFDGDDRPDVLLLGCGGRDVLLRNAGGGFEDATARVGPAGPAHVGGAAGDFDNDGRTDLALAGPAGLTLLRNAPGGPLEDITKVAGLGGAGPCTAAIWLDIDQDGDLDLLVCGPSGLALWLNVGTAPPTRADEPPVPLTAAFRRFDWPAGLLGPGPVTGLVALDLDGDGDTDLLALSADKPPTTILNDRLLRFRRGAPLSDRPAPAGLVLDAASADQSGALLLSDPPTLVTLRPEVPGATDAPALKQATRCDLDRDGRADVLGLTPGGEAVYLQGDGRGRLSRRAGALPDAGRLLAVAAVDIDGDGVPDLVCWAPEGLRAYSGIDNGNHSLRLKLTGRRDSSNAGVGQKNLRTNADATGAKVSALAGPLTARAELTTASAGPGQSSLPVELGLGRATSADAVRVRWPDLVAQAELAVPAGSLARVGETNRKPTSCPVLMTWDGSKWVFVTDCLGGGALGEQGADGSVRPSRPDEAVVLRPGQLGAKGGKYLVRVAEPMDEVLYLDHVRLEVIDHPPGMTVLPDERFAVADPAPTGELVRLGAKVFPRRATDHRGRDVLGTLREDDGRTASDFARRSWLGFAEDHHIEFDFGDLPAGKLWLVLAGWTDYPYPESILAASQAGVSPVWPVLERPTSGGGWEAASEIGLPAGLPKTMALPLPAGVGGRFRVRTNLQVHFDQAYLAAESPGETRATSLAPSSATLSHPGFVRELPGDPVAYDPNRFEAVATGRWAGHLTRLGDVTELAASVDDRLVLAGPGDEVLLAFDAAKLPPAPAGWTRTFVLRVAGYCKDTAPTTLTGGRVGPLPFRAMTGYPCEETPGAVRDRAAWHTRPAAGR